jgi:hypothetical protein
VGKSVLKNKQAAGGKATLMFKLIQKMLAAKEGIKNAFCSHAERITIEQSISGKDSTPPK